MLGQAVLGGILALVGFTGIIAPSIVLHAYNAQWIHPLVFTQFALASLVVLTFVGIRKPRSMFNFAIWALLIFGECFSGYFGIRALYMPLVPFTKAWVLLSLILPALIAYEAVGIVLSGVFIALCL